MTRSDFLFEFGIRPNPHKDLRESLAEYDATYAVFNEFLAGVVEERYKRFQQPTLSDYSEAWRLWHIGMKEFDLTTTYDTHDKPRYVWQPEMNNQQTTPNNNQHSSSDAHNASEKITRFA